MGWARASPTRPPTGNHPIGPVRTGPDGSVSGDPHGTRWPRHLAQVLHHGTRAGKAADDGHREVVDGDAGATARCDRRTGRRTRRRRLRRRASRLERDDRPTASRGRPARDVGDVGPVIRAARELGLPLAIRGGGHNVAGYGTVDGGIVLDLGGLTGVSVDPDTRRVRVDGRRDPRPSRPRDRAARARGPGRCDLGHRRRGPDARRRDRLADARLRADRRQPARGGCRDGERRADPRQRDRARRPVLGAPRRRRQLRGRDLVRVQGRPAGPDVFAGTFVYRRERWANALRGWDAWGAGPAGPDDLHRDLPRATARLRAGRRPGHAHRVAVGRRRTTPRASGSPTGCALPLRPTRRSCNRRAGRRGSHRPTGCSREASAPIGRTRRSTGSTTRRSRSSSTRRWNKPGDDTGFDIHHLGGAFARVPLADTPFPNRSARYWLNIYGFWPDPADDADRIAFVRGFAADMEPLASGGRYVNFLGAEDDRADPRTAALAVFGPEKLRAAGRRQAPLRPGQRVPPQPQHPTGLIGPQVRRARRRTA